MTLQYSALNVDTSEIRLLTIAPGDYDSEICCSLSVDSLLRHPKFEALSYVWGDPSITKNIIVDGTSHPVTVNLESALRDLRCTTMPRVIWADALCINQEDLVEKNHQIPLLGDIYRNAHDVVAYLGCANPYLEYFLVWSHVYTGKWRRSTSRRWIKMIVQSWISRKGANERAISIAQFFLGLRAFSDHPYFTRMWTFQEFLLPRRKPIFVIGRNSFRVDHINGSAWNFMYTECFPQLSSDEYMKGSPLFCDIYTQIEREVNNRKSILFQGLQLGQLFEEKRPNCLELFQATQSRDCFNPRDKIFALYSFIKEEFPDFCKPDYTKSVEQVLLETVSFLHKNKHGSLAWLMRIFPLRASGYDHALCPSWLPDLTAKQISLSYFQFFGMFGSEPILKAELSEDLLALTIKTRFLGKCNDPIIRFGTDPNQTLQYIARLIYPSKGDLDTATQAAKVPRQQIACASYSHHFSSSFMEVDEVLSIYRTIAKYKDFTDFADIPFSKSEIWNAAHVRAAAEELANRVFFCTDTGLFGTCSDKLEAGDTIMISPNFFYPFASRVLPNFLESSTQFFSMVEWASIGGIGRDAKNGKLFKKLMETPLESVSIR